VRAQVIDPVGGAWRAEQEALPVLTAELGEPFELDRALDSLGDDGQAERVGELDYRRDDRSVILRSIDGTNEESIDLHLADRESAQLLE
jgi:hypothetical protein